MNSIQLAKRSDDLATEAELILASILRKYLPVNRLLMEDEEKMIHMFVDRVITAAAFRSASDRPSAE